ncbi:enoyl-CoA hydratase/isomerase family protein [Bacillus sp. FJAT-45350]|uniref:enoyl-CoA hydratase/isomerase family protein n=1 Tax=Bacillus sp. FJAT-45350 TaxID=2011014 RepID=UPI000BB9A7EE|nr:enoyl-CoA hydratase/isomerase family protein [Bacillus sp. FJAT-45350]
MSKQNVLYTVENQVATITLNRPEVKNAIDLPTHEELLAAFNEADQDETVRLIVLTGTEDSFSAGADLKSIPINEIGTFDYGDYLRDSYNKLILKIQSIQKPTVALINGICVGAGLSIPLACDYRVAEPNAKFALSFLKIGLVPDAGASYFLPRLVGLGNALELALGKTISADRALEIGLINKIGNGQDFINQILQLPLSSYHLMKQNMVQGLDNSLEDVLKMEEEAQRQAGRSDEHHQAIMNFVKK